MRKLCFRMPRFVGVFDGFVLHSQSVAFDVHA